MDSLLNRYRNITALVLVILAQLVLLAYQVKNNQDVRIIRVWAVTAVTPAARLVESVRSGVSGFLGEYFLLRDARQQNLRMKEELGRLKLENQFLRNELATADRAQALARFQTQNPSRTLAARVIGTGAGANSRVIFVDRGAGAGVRKGMAVITPDGIVGKVLAAFPTASQVLLVSDPTFAAGVISQKNRVRGTLKGVGFANCKVDYVQNEEKVEVGELFFTSGDDRVFPKGTPAGRVTAVRDGGQFKEISVEPGALRHGLEEVLIVMQGVHQEIPEAQTASTEVYLGPPVPADPNAPPAPQGILTDADRLREHYQKVGAAQGHKFGEGLPGSRPPDFNLDPAAGPPQAGAPGRQPPGPGSQPAPSPEAPPPAAKPQASPASPAKPIP
ncbi:MAG: rod shape-determining protein MreC [Bryobacterales bacterium]|nr:rod shape-determining protein MreC [Bryobacterales bacterium]